MSLITRLQSLYANNSYEWDSSINLFGFRNNDGRKKDVWNDIIGVEVAGYIYAYIGTTDPGIKWYNERLRKKYKFPKGAAHLKIGQYKNAWKVGIHRKSSPTRHEALVQVGDVTIWRDYNRDFKDNQENSKTGKFGINIHRGQGAKIGLWSAGCQVIQGYNKFTDFMSKVKSSTKYQTLGDNARFTYTLFDKNDDISLYNDLWEYSSFPPAAKQIVEVDSSSSFFSSLFSPSLEVVDGVSNVFNSFTSSSTPITLLKSKRLNTNYLRINPDDNNIIRKV